MGALHEILDSLRGDAGVKDVRVCLRASSVWSRRLGLASILPESAHRCLDEPREPRRLSEMSARELAALALSRDPVEASVGLAAVNSLLDPPDPAPESGRAMELILRHGAGGTVVVVGHFPFVDRLRGEVRDLHVLELFPTGDDLEAGEAPRVIPGADVVAVTGTTLINHTFDGLMELARGKRVILIGPSTPLSPVLFDHGVDAICGSLVADPEAALRSVSEGVSFNRVEGLRRVNWARPSPRRT